MRITTGSQVLCRKCQVVSLPFITYFKQIKISFKVSYNRRIHTLIYIYKHQINVYISVVNKCSMWHMKWHSVLEISMKNILIIFL